MTPHKGIFRGCWVSVFAFVMLRSAPMEAHPLLQNRMDAEIASTELRLHVQSTLRDVVVSEQVVPRDGTYFVRDELDAAVVAHGLYLVKHVHVRADDTMLLGTVERAHLLEERDQPVHRSFDLEKQHAEFDLTYRFPPHSAPSTLFIGATTLAEFAYAPGQAWKVTYVLDVRREGSPDILATTLLTAGSTYRVPLPVLRNSINPLSTSAPWQNGAYVHLGIFHILSGLDHLLFVAALVIGARRIRDLWVVVGAFTVAHSLTLALAVLGLVRLPPWLVEPFIAGSIVYVALENFIRADRAPRPSRWLVGFGFGLLHGLGFAEGLLDALQPTGTTDLIAALFTFSLGVEIGHQLVILPLAALVFSARRHLTAPWRRRSAQWVSLFLSIAGVLFVVRALQT